jgi:hypothetical protein
MTSFFKEPDYGSGLFAVAARMPVASEAIEDDASGQLAVNAGETLESLVDRLLAPPVSKAAVNFHIIFLCLYRIFAAPGEVLDLFLARFHGVAGEDGGGCGGGGDGKRSLARTSTQLRHLGILLQWLVSYPGDFAHEQTRTRVTEFVSSLPHSRAYASVAKELRAALEVYAEDDDAIWARSDNDSQAHSTAKGPSSYTPVDAAMERLEGCVHALSTADDTATSSSSGRSSRSSGGGGGGDHHPIKPAARVSEVPSQSSSGANSTTLSGGSSQTFVTTVELAEREAQLLVPVPRARLTKILWRQFMDTPDDDFAEELTRIDWVMFSAMRPRDIVRHISLSTAERRGRSRSVENVDRMIGHFNHVACWVANIILFRDKPKHRAQALEKFMNIAWVRIRS